MIPLFLISLSFFFQFFFEKEVSCIDFCHVKIVIADEIDLLNVSFDSESAPDRISARAGLKELQKIAPSRRSAHFDFDDSDVIPVYRTKICCQTLKPISQMLFKWSTNVICHVLFGIY